MKGARPPRALVMMVRDEVRVIERCLQSVLPFIDTWVVVDTGSVDGTPEVVSEVLAGLPGQIAYRPWRDFGANRSEMMRMARGVADHLLLLDADMELAVAGEFPELDRPAYMVRHSGRLRYDVVRAVGGDIAWRFTGRTHEVIVGPAPLVDVPLLEGVSILHHADGGSRAHKLQRDRELLEYTLHEQPGNPRATFYLAQTYRDLADLSRAEEFYRRRSEQSTTDEESWYAAVQAADLRARHDADRGIAELLAAWDRRPTRAEPLYLAARHARRRGSHHLAAVLAEAGLALPVPTDHLFVHLDVYDWGLRAERGFSRLGAGLLDTALEDFDAVLAQPSLDAETRGIIEGARWRCLPADFEEVDEPGFDPLLETLAPSAQFAELRYDAVPDWPRFNPSIVATDDGFTVIVRNANYQLLTPGHRMLDDTRETRTVNHLLQLTAELEIQSVHQLVDRTDRVKHPTPILGFEDCRLIQVGSVLHAVASVRDADPDAWWTMMLLTLDGHDVVRAEEIPPPADRRPEKNWAPFVDGDELRLVYRWGPLQVIDRAGRLVVDDSRTTDAARCWRGGSQGVVWRNGWLFVVHEVEHSTLRRYRHRFVHLGSDGAVAASPTFTFTGHRIEFAAGLAIVDGQVLITLGVGDKVPALVGLDVADVDALLLLVVPASATVRPDA